MPIDVLYGTNPDFARPLRGVLTSEVLPAPDSVATERALGAVAGRSNIPNLEGWADGRGHPSVAGWPGDSADAAWLARERAAATQAWIRGDLGA